MNPELLFFLANLVFFIGTARLFRTAINNRKTLKDYDFYGSFFTFLGMLLSIAAQLELKFWIVLIIQLPTLAFWAYISIYSFNNRRW